MIAKNAQYSRRANRMTALSNIARYTTLLKLELFSYFHFEYYDVLLLVVLMLVALVVMMLGRSCSAKDLLELLTSSLSTSMWIRSPAGAKTIQMHSVCCK